jgi:hypothetical protein
VRGYFNYHDVPTNALSLAVFERYVTDLWRRTLRRRSQKDRIAWEPMTQRVERLAPRTNHPSCLAERSVRRHTQGARSYEAGGEGCGTFIVHTN